LTPKFLFTLGGDLGSQIISEPEGWAKIIFNLERDLTYWSLIENFEVPLIFYGKAEGKDGGYTYLSNAKNNGIDTVVTIDIQISFDEGSTYETCFDGRIDLSTAKETVYRGKIEAAIVRNDLWAVFMAKKSTPIDLLSATDIYGNARLGIPYQELNLPSQKIIQKYQGDMSVGGSLVQIGDTESVNNYYGQIDFDEEILSEVKEKFTLPIGVNISKPASLFTLDFDGTYYIDCRIEVSLFVTDFQDVSCDVESNSPVYWGCFGASSTYGIDIDYFISINGVEYAFDKSNDLLGASVDIMSTVFQFDQSFTLSKGDEIFIYAKFTGNLFISGSPVKKPVWVYYGKNGTQNEVLLPVILTLSGGICYADYNEGWQTYHFDFPSPPSANPNPSYLNIIANTTMIPTQANTVLLHDAGLSICDRILGKNDSFYSEFLGGSNTAIHYAANGCGYLNALTRGLNLRGYTFSEKPFTLSFDDWWAGANPVFNLGLGYEELSTNSPGSKVIRVENKSAFFNTTPSVYFTAINDIQIEFDPNLFTKTIEIGFEQWAAESASGIDDPQTKHIYNLRFQLFGKDEKQLSKFVAASLAIEQGRRLTKIQSNDWRLDENVFLIALQEQDTPIYPQTSPPTNTEQPEVFGSGISNLNNPETRYNVRHTPARILERWINFYSGQMQSYLTDFFKYASGEGNVLMSWTGDACDTGTLTENQNQSVSSNYLFLPIVYSFTHPLTWDEYTTIRDNRKNAISISWILAGVTYSKIAFIKKLGYDINKSKGTFEVWIRS